MTSYALVHFILDPVGFKVLDVFDTETEAVLGQHLLVTQKVAEANANRQAQFDRGEACRHIVEAEEFRTIYRIQLID